MTQELIDIIKKVKDKFTNESDLTYSSYNTAKELRNELNVYIDELCKGDKTSLLKLNILFSPTGLFQEHSLMNYWSEEYLILAKKFDSIYTKMEM